jgi:hypothetical protein
MPMPRLCQVLVVLLALSSLAPHVEAQGKGKGAKHDRVIVLQGHGKRPKVKKVVTSDEAVDVTRVVLREHGYDLVRVEQRGDVRVVYYRRGDMGRGRGKGPIMYMVLRPSAERIVIERAPQPLLLQINVRLGY